MAQRAPEPGGNHPGDVEPGNVDPGNVDLTADEFSAAVSAITSAFGDATRRDIYLFARERSVDGHIGVTAGEVARQFALHPNVARHHLDKLAAGSYLVVDLVRQESAGRPSKRYRVAETNTGLAFPPRRDDLVATLLARAIERLDPGEASAMAEEVGYEYGHQLAEGMSPTEGQRSIRSAMVAVADALTAHGFAAHTEAKGSELTIVSEHCAFGAAAHRYPHVLCAVDRGLIRGMLAGLCGDADPRFTERRPDGADHCVTELR